MKFATDENVIKTYNYASVGKLSETLTVTNKRVIISTEGKMPDGSAVHTTDEVKLNSIEKVSSRVASKRNSFLLVLMVLFVAAGVAAGVALEQVVLGASVGAVLAIICLIAFFLSKKVSFYLELTTGQRDGMGINALIGNWKPGKTKKTVKINVNEKVAIEVVEEIGALIIESQA